MTEVLEWILGIVILFNVLVAVYCVAMYRRRR